MPIATQDIEAEEFLLDILPGLKTGDSYCAGVGVRERV